MLNIYRVQYIILSHLTKTVVTLRLVLPQGVLHIIALLHYQHRLLAVGIRLMGGIETQMVQVLHLLQVHQLQLVMQYTLSEQL